MAAITIPIITEYDPKGLKRAERAFGQFKKQASNLGGQIRSAMLPAVAAVGALAAAGGAAVKAAIEDQKAQALLARQLKTTTGATKAQIAATEDWITATALATGVADDDLRPALATLVRGTRSTTKAQKALRVALNVSRATGKPLVKVAESLARAYGGNVKALARLDPSLKSFITKTTTADQAVAKLAGNFRGAADAAANTLQGRMERLNVAFGEAREEIGYALLPVFERLVEFITNSVLPYVKKVTAAFSKDGLSGAIRLVGGDLKDAIVNAEGFNGVLVNLGGTIIATAAIIKGAAFGVALKTAWGAGTTAVQGFATAIGTTAGTVLATIGLIVLAVYTLIDALRDKAFRSAFGEVLVNSLKLIANGFIGLYKIIQAAVNPLIRAFNKIPGIPNSFLLGDIDFQKFTFDANVPTPQRSPFTDPEANGGRAPGPVTINVNGGDPKQLVDTLRSFYRQNGPLPFGVAYG